MSINIRTKGASGEREIYNLLNPIVIKVHQDCGYPLSNMELIQRNSNQSAVGGNDLVNTYGLSIEIKRHETLSVNTWWAQCLAAANELKQHPVLLYRQNRRPWTCVTYGYLEICKGKFMKRRVTIDQESFLVWFEHWVKAALA